MTARRRTPPAANPYAAEDAAKAAAAAKAERAPHKLTAAEVMLLPGRKVLELGNAGRLRHLDIGTPPARQPVTPKGTRSAKRGSTPRVRKGR